MIRDIPTKRIPFLNRHISKAWMSLYQMKDASERDVRSPLKRKWKDKETSDPIEKVVKRGKLKNCIRQKLRPGKCVRKWRRSRLKNNSDGETYVYSCIVGITWKLLDHLNSIVLRGSREALNWDRLNNIVSRDSRGPLICPHYAETRQYLGVSFPMYVFAPSFVAKSTEKTIFPIPFKLNGIWSWGRFSFRYWTKWSPIWFKIEGKTFTMIISHSIWKELEI